MISARSPAPESLRAGGSTKTGSSATATHPTQRLLRPFLVCRVAFPQLLQVTTTVALSPVPEQRCAGARTKAGSSPTERQRSPQRSDDFVVQVSDSGLRTLLWTKGHRLKPAPRKPSPPLPKQAGPHLADWRM